MNKRKGISLIILVVTIIILIIISGVVIVSLSKSDIIEESEQIVDQSDIANYREELSKYVMDQIGSNEDFEKNELNTSSFDEMKKYIPSLQEKHRDLFKIVKGELVRVGEVKPEEKPEPEGKPNPEPNPDGGTQGVGTVNEPYLVQGMTPVKFVNGNWVDVNLKAKANDWYDYSKKKWANVRMKDGSMFVWIPRFAYSINEYKTNKTDLEGKEANIVNIEFIKGIENKYPLNYDASIIAKGVTTPMIMHPAFKIGNKELTGIWVAKFPATVGANTSFEDSANGKIKMVGNVKKWTNIRIGNAFAHSYKYLNNTKAKSHLMKNTEWGAVAYLSASKYGILPSKSSSINTGNKNYINNKACSTTGNVTGIYDMNSNVGEFVAGFINNKNAKITENGNPGYTEDDNHNSFKGKTLELNAELWDKYDVGDKEIKINSSWEVPNNNNLAEYVEETYNKLKNKNGDALYEIINTYSFKGIQQSWIMKRNDAKYDYNNEKAETKGKTYYNNDDALLGTMQNVFAIRGAGKDDNNGTGIFAVRFSEGAGENNVSFRPVIVEK